jgi:hypothetical protein
LANLECDHKDRSQCAGISCLPCCTACKECGKSILFGKMREHAKAEHGIDLPPVSEETKAELLSALDDLRAMILELKNG